MLSQLVDLHLHLEFTMTFGRVNFNSNRRRDRDRIEIDRKRIDTGHLKSAMTKLRRRLSAHRSRNAGFKIGITGDPSSRARSYQGQYGKMIVLYETASQNKVKKMEAMLVDEYREYCDNSIGGGGGPVAGPPYYLYIVI